MSKELSKTEYLKRYLEKDAKKRKKKNKSSSVIPSIKIYNKEIDIKSIKFGEEAIQKEEDDEEPVVAEVIDDRPEEEKRKEIYAPTLWKRMGSQDDRARHDSDSDPPPCHHTNSGIQSKQRAESESEISPRNEQTYQSRKRHDSDSDTSPSFHQKTSHQPMRRHDSDSDLSPPRVVSDSAGRTKHSKRTNSSKQKSDSDLSPERPGEKMLSQRRSDDSDLSPPRKGSENQSHKESKGKPTKTLSGLNAGLQNARTLKRETQELKMRERRQINDMDEGLSGHNAATIVRDRKTGKIKDMTIDVRDQEKEKKNLEKQQKYAEWGKGIEQTESRKIRLEEDVYETSKPLARYSDDKDLDARLRSVIHEEDPMAEYIKKKRHKGETSVMPEYSGPPPPPNRFCIKPGYRWDGVDRSNGFEKRYFETRNKRTATEEEAYMWSVQNM